MLICGDEYIQRVIENEVLRRVFESRRESKMEKIT
jgi:hypothetical protein